MENEINSAAAKAEVTSDEIFARIDKRISKPAMLGLTTLALLAHRDMKSPTKEVYMVHIPDDQVSNFSDMYNLGSNRILVSEIPRMKQSFANELIIVPNRPFDFIDRCKKY